MKMRNVVLVAGIIFLSCAKVKSSEQAAGTTEKKMFVLQDFEQSNFNGGVWEEFMHDRHVTFVGSKSNLVHFGEKGHSFALDLSLIHI